MFSIRSKNSELLSERAHDLSCIGAFITSYMLGFQNVNVIITILGGGNL